MPCLVYLDLLWLTDYYWQLAKFAQESSLFCYFILLEKTVCCPSFMEGQEKEPRLIFLGSILVFNVHIGQIDFVLDNEEADKEEDDEEAYVDGNAGQTKI